MRPSGRQVIERRYVVDVEHLLVEEQGGDRADARRAGGLHPGRLFAQMDARDLHVGTECVDERLLRGDAHRATGVEIGGFGHGNLLRENSGLVSKLSLVTILCQDGFDSK